MDPPIEDSIIHTRYDRWTFGSLYVCEIAHSVPNHAVRSWEFNGTRYYIRKRTTDEQESTEFSDSISNRIHHAGTSAAVWNIGGTFVKVKAWRQEMQLENDTIRFVNRISSIPTPEIIFSWVDTTWNRSFLISKAVEGQTLDRGWHMLSSDQHRQIARTVAHFCKMLAFQTSQMLQTAHGFGVLEPFLSALPPETEPSWRPQLLGPYSTDQLRFCLSETSTLDNHIKTFYFYHADLGPSNIIVAEDGSIAAIIDWESAVFYPLFWLGTKPLISAGFSLHGAETRAWATLLAACIEQEGFPSDVHTYQAWKREIRK